MLKEKRNSPSNPRHTSMLRESVEGTHQIVTFDGGKGNMRKGWCEENIYLLPHKSPYCLNYFTMGSIYY